jgi:hypothetical protein
MIITKTVQITISNQGKHYKEFGYENVKQGTKLIVLVEHLQNRSCIKVECRCDECGELFKRPYQQVSELDFHRCYPCTRKYVGKTANNENTIIATKSRSGEKHPRWNPNKKEFEEYMYNVRLLTENVYKQNKEIINPYNRPRTLCGVEGGYQLDHIISIKYGFDNNIPPEIIGSLENLQMLSWKENRYKWHK